jgi:broad specificity phosphatase PhoE
MTIIFARHGETNYNKEHRFQGIIQADLNTTGILQAQHLGEHCAMARISNIVSSPLRRAMTTANIVGERCKLKVREDSRLEEICYGEWEGKKKNDINSKLLHKRESERFKFMHPGNYNSIPGDSYENLFIRLTPLFTKIAIQPASNKTLVVSHSGVIWCAYRYFQKPHTSLHEKIRFKNNEILIVSRVNSRALFKVDFISI